MTCNTALVSIPANLVARDFIATGLVQQIIDSGLRVVLCCHARDRTAVTQLVRDLPVEVTTYREAGFKLDSAHALLADVRFSLHGTISGHMAHVRRRTATTAALRIWRTLCRNMPKAADAVLAQLEGRLAARALRSTGPLLDEVGAAVVVTPGPGFRAEDRSLLRAARLKGVPSVSVVSSWDNLTARGAVKSPPDVLAVWNEPMRRHAVGYHGFPSGRVAITGVPAFDPYMRVESEISRAQNAQHLRLPTTATRYITFLTGMLVAAAECADLQEMLERMAHVFPDGDAPWVVIRVHPNEDPSHYAELQNHPRVVLNYEGMENTGTLQQIGASPCAPVMTRDSHVRKAALLRYSDVVVASLCTTALVEATIFDRPVLAIERDRPGVDPAVQALIASLDSYTHQTDFRDTGALEVVADMDSAVAGILRARAHPEQRREQRAHASALLCGPLDGRSAERVARLIHRTATAGV